MCRIMTSPHTSDITTETIKHTETRIKKTDYNEKLFISKLLCSYVLYVRYSNKLPKLCDVYIIITLLSNTFVSNKT